MKNEGADPKEQHHQVFAWLDLLLQEDHYGNKGKDRQIGFKKLDWIHFPAAV